MDPKPAALEWLANKAKENPDFLDRMFAPAFRRTVDRSNLALHEAIRKGDFSQMKYAQGRLDGVQDVIGLIEGLRLSEGSKQSPEPGLMARMFGPGR